MKSKRVKEIQQYIKSLDKCDVFSKVKVVSIENFNRFDRYTIAIYLEDQLYEIAHLSVKYGSILTNDDFESQIKIASIVAKKLLKQSNALDDVTNRAPKEITTCVSRQKEVLRNQHFFVFSTARKEIFYHFLIKICTKSEN